MSSRLKHRPAMGTPAPKAYKLLDVDRVVIEALCPDAAMAHFSFGSFRRGRGRRGAGRPLPDLPPQTRPDVARDLGFHRGGSVRAPLRPTPLLYATLSGNCLMMPSVSMSAIFRIWSWTLS